MSPSDIGILLVIIVLLIFSALFSGCETAYASANRVRLRTIAAGGSKRAEKMLTRLEHSDRVLSALLIGNNVVNLTAATLSTILFISLMSNENLAATLSTVVLTLVILIFCEVTPKIIAKENPEKAGMALGPFLMVTMVLFFPLTWLFSQWKRLLRKMFRFKNESVITEDELLTYVETAASEGGIEQHESTLIKSAIEFEDVAVEDIMVPRVQVVAVSDTNSLDDIKAKFAEHEFSRMPVYTETVDSVIGILHEKDFQKFLLSGKKNLKDILQHNICVARTMKISVVLKMMQKARVHMAVVVDEFGGTSGIVTLEDILEELVGEIWDEHDEEEILMRRTGDDTYMVSGTESLSDMLDTLSIKNSEEFASTTVGGFVTELAGKIPLAGEIVHYDRLIITVTKANVKRVLEVRVKVLAEETET